MGKHALTNVSFYWAGYNLSGHHSTFALPVEQSFEDVSNFASGNWKEFFPVKPGGSMSGNGFWYVDGEDSIDPDAFLFGRIESPASDAFLLFPNGATAGDKALLGAARNGSYECFGPKGSVAPFAWSAKLDGLLVAGYVAGVDTYTATSNTTPINVTGPAAGSRMYAGLQVTAFTGTTATFALQSSATEGGIYTTRASFTAVTGIVGETISVAGPITDGWWRVALTALTGSSVSFAAALGVA